MDAEQPLGRLAAHRVRDGGAHVAPLGDVARVAEAVHQLRPRAGDAAGLPAELGRLAREAVARQGRQHQVECVLGGAAVRGRVGQRADGLEQLDDRAGPAMRHDQRQRVLMPRPDVDEVDLDPVDLGRELRQRVQSAPRTCASRTRSPSSGRAPAASPAARPATDLHELLGGPARRARCGDASPRVFVRNVDSKRSDAGHLICRSRVGHEDLLNSGYVSILRPGGRSPHPRAGASCHFYAEAVWPSPATQICLMVRSDRLATTQNAAT